MGIVDIRVDIRAHFFPAAPADGGMSSLPLLSLRTGHDPQRGRCILCAKDARMRATWRNARPGPGEAHTT